MYHFFIQAKQVCDGIVTMKGSDVNHVKNVLRMKPGEQVSLSDEDGVRYVCEITSLDGDSVFLNVLETEDVSHELPANITLFQGIPKGDKFETIIQKAVELGASKIVPVVTSRCVVKLDEKKRAAKLRRWSLIAESAAKQSKRSCIPEIGEVVDFESAIARADDYDVVCIPYEQAKGMQETKRFLDAIAPGMNVAFFIGPEGGFEEREVSSALARGITPISLGKRVLRTETAGMALMSMIMLNLEMKYGDENRKAEKM